MTTTPYTDEMAAFTETTAGTGPADAAAWVSNGSRFRVRQGSVDISALEQSMIEDERSQEDVLTEEQKIKGIKGAVEVPMETYLTGLGAATADGMQAPSNILGEIAERAFGGRHRGNSTVAATSGAHSDTDIELDSLTNLDEGAFIAIEDQDDAGRIHIRRILSISGSVATLDQALPFTVEDGDPAHACEVWHFDQAVLVDGFGGSRTMSFWYGTGLDSARENWEMLGCKPNFTGITIARNAAPVCAWNILVGSFVTPEAAADPSWSATPYGHGPLAIGPDSEFWMEDFGTSDNTTHHLSTIEIEPNVLSTGVDAVTEKNTGLPGRGGYSLAKGSSNVNLTLVPFAQSHYTDFEAGTLKAARFSRIAAAGSAWAISFPRAEIVATPKKGASNDAMAQMVSLRPLMDVDNSAASDAALWRSRMTIVRA